LEPEEILVGIKNKEGLGVETDGEFTVGLQTEISGELAAEGFARELVHHIQNLRKEAGFEIENTINVSIEAPGAQQETIDKFNKYISKETLSGSIGKDFDTGMFVKEVKVNGTRLKIGIKVVGSIV
ncbi:MAG: DUF5915 domain-containing protein, partial [Actinobacteria bacterium]|nr:DUF5915 domain-containing protein [Actinomycetota bacterium]